MSIPDFQNLMLPILRILGDGQELRMKDVTSRIADELGLTDEERAEMLPSGQA